MKPAPFAYHRPGPSPRGGGPGRRAGAKVLAGGQSLVPLLSMRLAAPSALVDINGCRASTRSGRRARGVRIGALARHADVLASADVRRVQPLVTLALAHVAHATIRNRGTTVGSIVHADAAAEMPVVMACSAARSTSRDRAAGDHPGRRAVRRSARVDPAPRRDRRLGALPGPGGGAGVAFEEIARRHGDYALVGVGRAASTVTPVQGRLPLGQRRADRRRPDGVADDDVGEAALAQLDPATTCTPRRRTVPSWCGC